MSEERELLRATVAALVDKHASPAAVREAMVSERGYDASLWKLLCEQVGAADHLIDCLAEEPRAGRVDHRVSAVHVLDVDGVARSLEDGAMSARARFWRSICAIRSTRAWCPARAWSPAARASR